MKHTFDTTKLVKKKGHEITHEYCRLTTQQAIAYNEKGNYSWKSIARSLGMSTGTLDKHRKRYYKEMKEKAVREEKERKANQQPT